MSPSPVFQSRVGITPGTAQMEMLVGQSTAKRAGGSAAYLSNNSDVDNLTVYTCNFRGLPAAPQLSPLCHETLACDVNTTNSRRKRARFNEPRRYHDRLIQEARDPEDHRPRDDQANSLPPNARINYSAEGMLRSKFSERNPSESSSARRLESPDNQAPQGTLNNRPNDLVSNQSASMKDSNAFVFTSRRKPAPGEQLPWLLHTDRKAFSSRGLANRLSARCEARANATRNPTSSGFARNAFTDDGASETEHDYVSSALPTGRAADHMEAGTVEPGLFGNHYNSLSKSPFLGTEVDLFDAGTLFVSPNSANDCGCWNYTSPTSFLHDLDSGSEMTILPSHLRGGYESTLSNTGFPPSPYQATLDSNASALVDTSELSHQLYNFHEDCVSHLADGTTGAEISQWDIICNPDTLGYSEGMLSGSEYVFNGNTLKELPSLGPWNSYAVTHADFNTNNTNTLPGIHFITPGDFEMDHNSMDFPVTGGTLIQQQGIGYREHVNTCK